MLEISPSLGPDFLPQTETRVGREVGVGGEARRVGLISYIEIKGRGDKRWWTRGEEDSVTKL